MKTRTAGVGEHGEDVVFGLLPAVLCFVNSFIGPALAPSGFDFREVVVHDGKEVFFVICGAKLVFMSGFFRF